MPIVPHLSELAFGVLWVVPVVLLVLLVTRTVSHRQRRARASEGLTTRHHERGEDLNRGR